MFCHLRLLTLLLGFCLASALAGPVWWMGAYNFRCKPPGYVEVSLGDWNGEWRVSSICKPGTCCSNYANTGPLCTVEACGTADKERERLTTSHNYAEARRKKKQQEDDERNKETKEQEAMKKWKEQEAKDDKGKEAALAAAAAAAAS